MIIIAVAVKALLQIYVDVYGNLHVLIIAHVIFIVKY